MNLYFKISKLQQKCTYTYITKMFIFNLYNFGFKHYNVFYPCTDLDECSGPELNDCHPLGKCTNVFGTFQCACPDGYRDPWIGNAQRSGRTCETCDPGQCNLRGECFFQAGQPVCK